MILQLGGVPHSDPELGELRTLLPLCLTVNQLLHIRAAYWSGPVDRSPVAEEIRGVIRKTLGTYFEENKQ